MCQMRKRGRDSSDEESERESPSRKDECRNPSPPNHQSHQGQAKPREDEDADRIPGTTFSRAFLLHSLVLLANQKDSHELSEDAERALETLWDMTQSKVVGQLLMQHGFPGIALGVSCSNKNPRLQELVGGMLGNMAAQGDVVASLASDPALGQLLVELLRSREVGTLVEALRTLCGILQGGCFQSDNFESRLSEAWEEEEGTAALILILASTTSPRILQLASQAVDLLHDLPGQDKLTSPKTSCALRWMRSHSTE